MQGAPPVNAGNLSLLVNDQLAVVEEATIFMNRSEVETILRTEKEKAYALSIRLDLKPPYAAGVAAKPHPVGYVTP